eukprot:6028325-Amphidinium_carterae.2
MLCIPRRTVHPHPVHPRPLLRSSETSHSSSQTTGRWPTQEVLLRQSNGPQSIRDTRGMGALEGLCRWLCTQAATLLKGTNVMPCTNVTFTAKSVPRLAAAWLADKRPGLAGRPVCVGRAVPDGCVTRIVCQACCPLSSLSACCLFGLRPGVHPVPDVPPFKSRLIQHAP